MSLQNAIHFGCGIFISAKPFDNFIIAAGTQHQWLANEEMKEING
jgi:hypothetical protein